MLFDIVVVVLTRNSLDNGSEKDKAVVAITPFASRLELQPPIAVKGDVIVRFVEFFHIGFIFWAKNITRTSGMC